MVKGDRQTWKANYFLRLKEAFETYNSVFLVGADNVGSRQMQHIRKAMRGRGVILMGKNTMMRKAIRSFLTSMPQLERILPYVRGNVGFVFTNEELKEMRDMLESFKVPAAAKAGAIAPISVTLPKQNTGLGPEKTSFFQALAIGTKITRGTIEIMNDVDLIKEGTKVGASEATLLQMLKIMPFSYSLVVQQVYDSGSIFPPNVLDISQEDLLKRFMEGVTSIACVSLAINYPTVVSVPHSMARGFKNVLAIAAATDITFKEAERIKEFLADPSKFVVAAAPAAAPEGGGGEGEKKEEAAKEESEEESDEDMGMGLFD